MRRPKIDHADWHVTARGARRLLLFHEPPDYQVFYGLLGKSCIEANVRLVADCLMSNHFHLCLSGSSSALTRCMQRLNRAYSGYHNEKYGLSGHAFDREYYGEAIPSDFILQRVVRYIHLNPVRGGKVDRPESYPWSSYRRMIQGQVEALGPEELRFLGLFNSDVRTAQQTYQRFTENDLYRRILPPVGKTPAWEIWQEQFGWILEHIVEHESDLLPLGPDEIAVHFGSRMGIPPRAMGKVLGHPDGRRVSSMIRNFERRLERNPGLQLKLDALRIL